MATVERGRDRSSCHCDVDARDILPSGGEAIPDTSAARSPPTRVTSYELYALAMFSRVVDGKRQCEKAAIQ